MRIGIITQPLRNNYGGLLQNYALQQVLKKLGHEAITLDQKDAPVSHIRFIASWGIKRVPARKDCYYGPFVKNESFRESCYQCLYATQERVSDITMGDCDSEKLYPKFYPYESKSIVLLNSSRGIDFCNKIQVLFEYTKLDYEKDIEVNSPLHMSSPRPPKRKNIYKDLNSLPW